MLQQPLAALYAHLVARRPERGATATEYALIIAGIALVIFVAVTAFGETLEGLWEKLGGELENVGNDAAGGDGGGA